MMVEDTSSSFCADLHSAVGAFYNPDEFRTRIGQRQQRAAQALVDLLEVGDLVQGSDDDGNVALRAIRQGQRHSAGAGAPRGWVRVRPANLRTTT
jgi:hypothetical protein